MRLPYDLISGNYIKPRFFLCETDKTRICQLETTNTNGVFKFNSYSELSFEVARVYNDLITGLTYVNPFYDRIESLRLIEVEGFGFFEIQGPNLSSDGIKESKNINAYSLEYTLSQKYLEDFYTVNGRDEWAGSLEDLWQIKHNDTKTVPSIVLYNPNDKAASLLHLILEKIYGWKVGHVDASLWTLSRDFDVDRESVYDFIMNEICEKFNCYVVFDTINNEINFYAESLTSKFVGDGKTKKFTISPPFGAINTVSVGSYKTTLWAYDSNTGVLTLDEAPQNGEMVEVIDGAMEKWETDVFVSFDNLAQEIHIDYDSESIKTVLTVNYGDDGNIREVNLGLPYLIDLSYYYTPEWMGPELYEVYTEYLKATNQYQTEFTDITQQRTELSNKKDYEENRLSLGYVIANSVNSETNGTYYVRSGVSPNYTYKEVTLPADYKPNVTYYMTEGCNLQDSDDGNVLALYDALGDYFYYYYRKVTSKSDDPLYKSYEENRAKALDDLKDLGDRFKFMKDYQYTVSQLASDLPESDYNKNSLPRKKKFVRKFLDKMWNEIGRTPLQSLYLEPYNLLKTNYVTDGWSSKKNENYGKYYLTNIFVASIKDAISARKKLIDGYQKQIDELSTNMSNIGEALTIKVFFSKYFKEKYSNETEAYQHCEQALVRLSAFLREDELQLDDIVEVETDTLEDIYKTKQDAKEAGRIELQKLCQPQLQFSMNMANIYALPEFKPIIDQFQLGNVIKVALRSDYIKQSRLLQVNINFDNFADFSCDFGDLTNLRTQSDIHADLLKKAVSAGKSVATNASYWTKGSDRATETELKIQKGLLDAATAIKSIDGTQSVEIDKYGVHLLKKDPNTGEIDPKQGWIVNNQFLYSDDAFETTKAVFGEYTVPVKNNETGTTEYQTYWGLLAEAVIAGYIEGSDIVGGTLKIGDLGNDHWALKVDENGNISMLGGYINFTGGNGDGSGVVGGVLKETIDTIKKDVLTINQSKMYRVEVETTGSQILSHKDQTAILTAKVYSWDEDVTSQIDSTLFNWIRTSNNPDEDLLWNADHQCMKSIKITTKDIVNNAGFSCVVDLETQKEGD